MLSSRHEIKEKTFDQFPAKHSANEGVTDVYQMQTSNTVDNPNTGIAFCLVS